jgi:hypothetical protein
MIDFDLFWFEPTDMGNDDPFIAPLGAKEVSGHDS